MRSNWDQIVLIALGIATTVLLGIFFYREIAPEYLIYQDDYIELEKFRSTYTKEPPPAFKTGVKQILIEREDKGPPLIDRCTSCHVALQIEDYSPTKIARDVNGDMQYDALGFPLKVDNPSYIWKHLDDEILSLRDSKENEKLKSEGKQDKAEDRLALADKYEALKKAQSGEFVYDVEKVLRMHPLMGRETRPFEFHPIEEYGCTSCHGGNGRGLTTDRAHGPVFDGQYEIEDQGPRPKFLEIDPENDPPFSKVFNNKPGPRLIFQTNPIYVGALIQAKCMACHQDTQGSYQRAVSAAEGILKAKQKEAQDIDRAYELEKKSVVSLEDLKQKISKDGYEKTFKNLEAKEADYTLADAERDKLASQIKYLKRFGKEKALNEIDANLDSSFGSRDLSNAFDKAFKPKNGLESLEAFINETSKDKGATGSLYRKATSKKLITEILLHVQDVGGSFQEAVDNEQTVNAIQTDVDKLTEDYHHGQDLYISQACYACHRIAGFSRGGVGPDLTHEGDAYPWYVKQKISWPQSDLKTSTMPNYRLDHEELEDLVAFVLGQKGPGRKFSDTAYKAFIQEWEAGKKLPWEKPATPAQIHDIRYGMTVFATEGCAACHRLRGFESNVGFQLEKEKPSFDALYRENLWFQKLFPEDLPGSMLVNALEKQGAEIDKRIVDGVRKDSILEEIDEKHPGMIEGLYTNFKFAARAQNSRLENLAKQAKTPEEKKKALDELKEWKDRVHRVLMVYIQQYGLGRLICPRPNWSGIFRSDQWLMEHFRNPGAHVPRSIMPVFPFDDTKFYALTYMLDMLAEKNNAQDRAVWKHYGFDPESAFQQHCSQCHGEYLLGNGPVSEWIYPIPKNLRRADFLRNLTKENAIQSITHGVKGTPMPPWGELAPDKPFKNNSPVLNEVEIKQLVDWLFSSLPGETVIRHETDVPKWNYEPKDVLEELYREGGELKGEEDNSKSSQDNHAFLSFPPEAAGYLASLDPMPVAEGPKKLSVGTVFDMEPNPVPGGEKEAYYIKKKYYTPENILQGQQFFLVNCAPCHGAEADGSGVRAEAMNEAKPRMLINLDWLKTRDDLRLLRSIKYGVPGTAMTPWGDLTSSLQRIQLVIFIRSLSQGEEERSGLTEAIYKVFDNAEFTIERARIHEFTELDRVRKEYERAKSERKNLDQLVAQGKAKPEEGFDAYRKELELGSEAARREQVDGLFQALRKNLKEEKDLFRLMGEGFMNLGIDNEIMGSYLKLVDLYQGRFSIRDEHLNLNEKIPDLKKLEDLKDFITERIDTFLKDEETKKTAIEGRLPSPERTKDLAEAEAKITGLEKQKRKFLSGLEEAQRLNAKQNALYQSIQEKIKPSKEKEEQKKSAA